MYTYKIMKLVETYMIRCRQHTWFCLVYETETNSYDYILSDAFFGCLKKFPSDNIIITYMGCCSYYKTAIHKLSEDQLLKYLGFNENLEYSVRKKIDKNF